MGAGKSKQTSSPKAKKAPFEKSQAETKKMKEKH